MFTKCSHLFAYGDLDRRCFVLGRTNGQVYLPTNVSADVDVGHIVLWHRFDPDALPNATTWPIIYMRRFESLFADRDLVVMAVCRIESEYNATKVSFCLLIIEILRTVHYACCPNNR